MEFKILNKKLGREFSLPISLHGRDINSTLKELNLEDVANYGYKNIRTFYKSSKEMNDYDMIITDNKLILSKEFLGNTKIYLDSIIIFTVFQYSKEINKNLYKKELYRFLALALEGREPSKEEYEELELIV